MLSNKMGLHFMLFSIFLIMIQVHAIPVGPEIDSKGVTNSNKSAAINATIFDHTGHDITSSFQIRWYYPEVFANNVANNSLSKRQETFSRPVNECPGVADFRESFCTPEVDKAGSLQRYTIVCRETFTMIDGVESPIQNDLYLTYAAIVGAPPMTRQETFRRDGHCDKDEICVSGLGIEASARGKRMASCVRNEYFIKYISWGNNQQQNNDLEGKMASMLVSQQDGTTPIEVDTLEVDTETAGVVQENRCRDCVELKTTRFGADTRNLRFQTRLLTAGTMAGVLWLAIASG